jgi:hypothetical protein
MSGLCLCRRNLTQSCVCAFKSGGRGRPAGFELFVDLKEMADLVQEKVRYISDVGDGRPPGICKWHAQYFGVCPLLVLSPDDTNGPSGDPTPRKGGLQRFTNVLKSFRGQAGRPARYLPADHSRASGGPAVVRPDRRPHSVVFAGLSSDALRDRITDAEAQSVGHCRRGMALGQPHPPETGSRRRHGRHHFGHGCGRGRPHRLAGGGDRGSGSLVA